MTVSVASLPADAAQLEVHGGQQEARRRRIARVAVDRLVREGDGPEELAQLRIVRLARVEQQQRLGRMIHAVELVDEVLLAAVHLRPHERRRRGVEPLQREVVGERRRVHAPELLPLLPEGVRERRGRPRPQAPGPASPCASHSRRRKRSRTTTPRSVFSAFRLEPLRVSKRTTGASTGSTETYSIEPSPSKNRPTTSSPARTGAARPDFSAHGEVPRGQGHGPETADGLPDLQVVEPLDRRGQAGTGRARRRSVPDRRTGGPGRGPRARAHVCILSVRRRIEIESPDSR